MRSSECRLLALATDRVPERFVIRYSGRPGVLFLEQGDTRDGGLEARQEIKGHQARAVRP